MHNRKSMADVHTTEIRSCNIGQIKGKNTNPEILVRKFLHKSGLRYRLHVNTMPRKSDLVLLKYKTVVFIHGCFWHGHGNCKYYTIPKTRTEWWLSKINSNILNDKNSIATSQEEKWKIIIIWGCQLKKEVLHKTLSQLLIDIRG